MSDSYERQEAYERQFQKLRNHLAGLNAERRQLAAQLQSVTAERDRYLTALQNFTKFCIKPECTCWACQALTSEHGKGDGNG